MSEIFCVQDRTGTAAQLTIDEDTPMLQSVLVGDTGAYTGRDWEGEIITLDFTVGAVNGPLDFCITTMTPVGASGDVTKSNWPKVGAITWLTGDNADMSPGTNIVVRMHKANAYIDPFYYIDFHNSRGNVIVESPLDDIQKCIVKSSDYLNQKYRYKGTKLLQILSGGLADPMLLYIDPWLSPAFLGGSGIGIPGGRSVFAPSRTNQLTEWPRQGVIDYSGDNVFGIPQVIKEACAIGAKREQDGTSLQPDYDPDFVGNGGVFSSFTNEIGPIRESKAIDTQQGIGFFPDIPQIRRMLSKAGVLLAGGGRSLIR